MFRVVGLSTITSLALAASPSALFFQLVVLFEFGRVVFIEAILGIVHFLGGRLAMPMYELVWSIHGLDFFEPEPGILSTKTAISVKDKVKGEQRRCG